MRKRRTPTTHIRVSRETHKMVTALHRRVQRTYAASFDVVLRAALLALLVDSLPEAR